jgi:hypothetical protein
MKIVYEKGQVLGKHGVRYLEELQGIERKSSSGKRFIERRALFKCGKCGKEFAAAIQDVKRKNKPQVGCGCSRTNANGLNEHPLYKVWGCMKQRCFNKNNPHFKYEGSKGISVCNEWLNFLCFHDWALLNGWEKGLHIQRIDRSKDYTPTNCRIAQTAWDGLSKIENGDFHPLYKLWRGIKRRCLAPNAINHERYGGRGITICSDWIKSFTSFYEWAISAGWAPGLQIDRIDNEGNYSPMNCRFVEPAENARNRRSNKFCYLDGEKIIFAEAERRLGLTIGTISRWYRGIAVSKQNPLITFEDSKSV